MAESATQTTTRALKWAWRHFRLCVDEFDSLEDALADAEAGRGAGHESLETIEVWDESGYRRLSVDDCIDLWDEQDANAPDLPPAPPDVATLWLRSGDDWGRFRGYAEMAAAEADTARFAALLGADRVELRVS